MNNLALILYDQRKLSEAESIYKDTLKGSFANDLIVDFSRAGKSSWKRSPQSLPNAWKFGESLP
jgi:hypothetical protein